MNVIALPTYTVRTTWEETSDGQWDVRVGHESRCITKDGPASYIAWIGCQSRHWCFAKALKACVDDMEYRLAEAALAQAAHDEAIASLMRMTGAEKARLVAKLEQERDWLDYSGSEVNVTARKAVFEKQIATLRAV